MRKELIEQFTQEKVDKVDAIVEKYRRIPGSLIIVLQQVQELCLYLPLSLQRYIAKKMNVSPSKIYGVVTFYAYFSTVPKGRRVIKVCTGTACYVKRSEDILQRLRNHLGIKHGEVTDDGEFSIEEARCLGACGLAPVVTVGDETFGLVDPDKAEEILR